MAKFKSIYLKNEITGALLRISSPYELHAYSVNELEPGKTQYIYEYHKALVPLDIRGMRLKYKEVSQAQFYRLLRLVKKKWKK